MKRSEQFAEIREIADAICNYSATTEQKQRLEQLLDNNIDAQQYRRAAILLRLYQHAYATRSCR